MYVVTLYNGGVVKPYSKVPLAMESKLLSAGNVGLLGYVKDITNSSLSCFLCMCMLVLHVMLNLLTADCLVLQSK